jgi:error-prone DNA polymerase
MLSLVEECVELIARRTGTPPDLSRIDFEDPAIYDRICAGATIGLFQIESRAQIQMIRRARPRNLEDLAVEVAIVRPGPIVGGAVNPYVRRREEQRRAHAAGLPYEPPVDHPLLRDCLTETLGVILYQDQVLQVCQALAGFTTGQSEALRRAMSRRRSHDLIAGFWEEFRQGALARGVPEKTAEKVFAQVIAFSEFGFPKSHAAAFGLLAYQSAWLRHHHPAEFLCSLLNAQPMGFYPPATLVRDGQRRGVETRPPDVNVSSARCKVEDGAVRIGVDYVNGIGEPEAKAVVEERQWNGPFRSVRDLAQRTQLSERGLETLIVSGACDCFGMPRRQLLWQLGLVPRSHSVPGSRGEEKQLALPLDPTAATPDLPEPTVWERMLADYRTTNLSVGVHPLELLRAHLPPGVISSRDLEQAPDRAQVAIAGMAVARQRPATANGVVFMLIEDEFGAVNLIVPPSVYDKHRAIVRGEPLILARGRFERIERNQNVLVRSLETLGSLARQVSQETEVGASLPGAHHFGHR